MDAQPFDHLNTALEGRKLIESSAGTGKTYAIASLYVRLLLERGLQVHEILVVTFTEAATAELQNRIRGRIRETLRAAEGTPSPGDGFVTGLLARAGDRRRARRILSQALRSFDQAAIFTIHGFCQKALQENAFESSSPFDTELVTDQDPILRQIVDDFWRANFHSTSPSLMRHALRKNLRDQLPASLGGSLFNPALRVVPEGKPDLREVMDRERRAAQAKESLAESWSRHSGQVRELLLGSEGLNKKTYKPESITGYLDEVDVYLASEFLLPVPNGLTRLTAGGLLNGTRKHCSTPRHKCFDAAETLVESLVKLRESIEGCLLALKAEFIRWARRELPKRKRQRNIRSFDDLLLDMREALAGPAGGTLAGSLRKRFRAALIDEFQDTDPVQYEIFRTIFDSSSLFLIGDPKQAIYGFRGADIFAYMKAAEDVQERFTLSRNWRSTPGLVRAVNTIFSGKKQAFVFAEIRYFESQSALGQGETDFVLDGEACEAPLKVWFLKREDGARGPMNKGDAEKRIPDAVASEIARLLNAGAEGHARIKGSRPGPGERPISPWDIAVLVRTNEQARQVQRALRERRVPSVIYGTGSVFETDEAAEAERLLLGVADPRNEGKVKAALATSILGLGGDELSLLSESDSEWDARLRAFSEYRDTWAGFGFVTMARTLLLREGVRKRLLAFPDGERRLTDLLHCFELLQDAAVREKLGVEGLLKWFAVQRQGGGGDKDAQQIRLETDEKALKVITVHKSKGLEFPIVFCPYAWSALEPGSDQATCHDPEDKTVLIKDLGSPDLAGHLSAEKQEALAEQCRLFYVALTRARHRCYVCWGAVRGAGLTAPAYLLHHREGPGSPAAAQAVREEFESLTDNRIMADLERLERSSGGAIEILAVPDASPECCRSGVSLPPVYGARQFRAGIERDWGTASFSGWTAGRPHGGELPDHDAAAPGPSAVEGSPVPAAAAGTLLGFHRGVRAGSFLHAVFEDLDFTLAETQVLEELVSAKLDAFGFERAWQAAVCRSVRDVLTVPLGGPDCGIVLGRLPRGRRLAEMEFHLPLGRVTAHDLMEVFESCPAPPVSTGFAARLGRLGFVPLRGMMRGFVDLVFEWGGRYYLLDWKSNFLGPAVEDYSPESLREAMESSYYVLQYHLYSVALNRYLAARVPGYDYERAFGGVFYVYLRGVDPAHGPGFGIYRDKPPAKRIEQLSSLLSEGG